MQKTYHRQQGFSLVELSIVLVILGLLTGGILTGQSLIRAAELRSVVTEFQRYQTATRAFQDKYFALPGDMKNATSFWGSAGGDGNITGTCSTQSGTGTQTCNGNGNGVLNSASGANVYGESFAFWQHLANAGLVEGSFNGKSGAGTMHTLVPGTNSPQPKLSNAGWYAFHYGDRTNNYGDNKTFNANYQNTLRFINVDGSADIIKPEEAWMIDTKLDDGMPARGRLMADSRIGCAVAANGATLTTAAADAAKLDSKYNLNSSANVCGLVMLQLF
tara:strand:+ start:2129 stop:2953 length:825 start_codon:yes stop_codon:yes gene_type:complete